MAWIFGSLTRAADLNACLGSRRAFSPPSAFAPRPSPRAPSAWGRTTPRDLAGPGRPRAACRRPAPARAAARAAPRSPRRPPGPRLLGRGQRREGAGALLHRLAQLREQRRPGREVRCFGELLVHPRRDRGLLADGRLGHVARVPAQQHGAVHLALAAAQGGPVEHAVTRGVDAQVGASFQESAAPRTSEA